jgi:hypothetical protein
MTAISRNETRNEERRAERAAKRDAIVAEYTERRDALKKRMAEMERTRRALEAEIQEAIAADQPLPPGLVARVDRTILACNALHTEVSWLPADGPVAYVANNILCDLIPDMNRLAESVYWLDGDIGAARRHSLARREARHAEPIQGAHG